MNFVEWNIIKDDFIEAEKVWNSGDHSWVLVNCTVLYADKEYNWCLHYDEYMYRKCSLELKSMENEPVPLSIIEDIERQKDYWLKEIEEREQAEEDAGEDL